MAQDAAGTAGARVSPQVDSLIRAAQAGDQDAFGQLVRTYDQSVLRLAMNLLRSPEDARDVYQEAFLRVYRNLHGFRFDCSFHTWLYRIVTNICLDLLRKRKVRKEEPSVVETSDGPIDRLETDEEGGAGAEPQRAVWNPGVTSPSGPAGRPPDLEKSARRRPGWWNPPTGRSPGWKRMKRARRPPIRSAPCGTAN